MTPKWYEILKAVRKVARKGKFSSRDLGREAKLDLRIASAWLGKFCRWGYVVRDGSEAGANRWVRLYSITRWGEKYAPKKNG